MTTLRAMLDASLEIVIGFARASSVVAVLIVFGEMAGWVWSGDWRCGGVALVALSYVILVGWFGWWWFGNEEWRRVKTVDGASPVRHD